MTHNLSFRYHAGMTTKGLRSTKLEVHVLQSNEIYNIQLPESFNLYTCNPKLQECYIVL